ncbi:MAG: universal stress protein [Alphaproteobacteria bacterium]
MKTILVPIHDDDATEAALTAALHVARRFGSYVEGLHIRRIPQVIAGEGFVIPPDRLESMADRGRSSEAEQARFRAFVTNNEIAEGDLSTPSDAVVAGWREIEGQETQVIAEYGRLFDLFVVGRTGNRMIADWMAACEAALFESGRPVLLAPSRAPASVAKRVVIAWNGSTETARTIGLAVPLLQRAEVVQVLTVEGGTVPGPAGEQVAAHLARYGVATGAETVERGGLTVGEKILDYAGDFNCDLLIKGAFTHSRLRQMIFGGPTQQILNAAEMPVLLAH